MNMAGEWLVIFDFGWFWLEYLDVFWYFDMIDLVYLIFVYAIWSHLGRWSERRTITFFKQHWLSRHVWNLLELRNVYIDFVAWFRNKLQRGQLSCSFRENDHQAEEDDDTEEDDDPLMGFKLSMFRSFRKWVVYLHHPATLGSSLFRALARAPLNVYMCVSYIYTYIYIVARHISWRNLQS